MHSIFQEPVLYTKNTLPEICDVPVLKIFQDLHVISLVNYTLDTLAAFASAKRNLTFDETGYLLHTMT
jgi:hypothetical protein